MDIRFEAFIAAAVERAKAAESLIWADEMAERIAASTPLSVHAPDISEQIARAAVRAGVAVSVAAQKNAAAKAARCGCAA